MHEGSEGVRGITCGFCEVTFEARDTSRLAAFYKDLFGWQELSREGSMKSTGRCDQNSFFCECGDPRCARTITATIQEYESVRERANHFLIVLDHENPEVECVIFEAERFAVVETLFGEASKVALRTDSRSLCVAEWN